MRPVGSVTAPRSGDVTGFTFVAMISTSAGS